MSIRDRNLYLSWITMTDKEREDLYVKSFTDKKSRSLFNKIYTSVRIETNKRLKDLRSEGYAYGKMYNELTRYLEIEQGRRTVPTASRVNNNLIEMATIADEARKFLKNKYSKVKYREEVAERQIEFFESNKEKFGEMFAGWDRKTKTNFLKWLSNEEVSFTLDEYGTSDETVVILADAYENASKKTNGIKTLNKAMLEFSAGSISFDDAMKKVGVNISEQHSDKSRRWHFEKQSKITYTR